MGSVEMLGNLTMVYFGNLWWVAKVMKDCFNTFFAVLSPV